MHRFFVDKSQIKDYKIEIIGSDVKHIKDVIRLKIGEKLQVSSEGITYDGEIEEISKKVVIVKINDKFKGKNEPSTYITLYQGLAKSHKMDLIIQKCTEIGVSEFYPVATGRAVAKIKDEKRVESKVNRWSQISDEASKQSKRDIRPIVNEIINFDDMINLLSREANILVPYEDETINDIKSCLNSIKNKRVNIVIGPEGGFQEREIEKLKDIGASIVTLGPRILRTETAGIVTATIVFYELGDLGVL